MKLSEAIRLGAMIRAQVFGIMRSEEGTCAWGAAYEAAGIPIEFSLETGVIDMPCEWLWANVKKTRCPELNCDIPPPQCCVSPLIAHLNDHHRWSRERIAAWVKGIEPEEYPVWQCEPETAMAVAQ